VSFPAAASIGEAAFAWNLSLTSVYIPSVRNISRMAFDSDTSLARVTLGEITEANFAHLNEQGEAPSFPGNLREVYLAQPAGQRAGTYVTDNPGHNAVWRRE
jgi:hypothetical protein